MGDMTALQFILSLLGTSAMSGAIVKIVDYIIEKKRKKDDFNCFDYESVQNNVKAVKTGNQVLLRFRIKAECVEHINDGWIDVDDLDILEQMHKAYKDLGGNGYLNSLMERVKQLPLKRGDEHGNILE